MWSCLVDVWLRQFSAEGDREGTARGRLVPALLPWRPSGKSSENHFRPPCPLLFLENYSRRHVNFKFAATRPSVCTYESLIYKQTSFFAGGEEMHSWLRAQGLGPPISYNIYYRAFRLLSYCCCDISLRSPLESLYCPHSLLYLFPCQFSWISTILWLM